MFPWSLIGTALKTGAEIYKNKKKSEIIMSEAQIVHAEKMNLDKMRTMMNQRNQDEKLDQNEELAKLRADTSIEKTILSKTIPSADSMMKNSENMVPNIEIMRKG